ncbi:TPA: hypothetical protein ACFP4Y_000491 [Neisseria bacilliformis]
MLFFCHRSGGGDGRRQSALGWHIGAIQGNNKPLNLNKRSDYCAGRREKVFCRRKNRASYPALRRRIVIQIKARIDFRRAHGHNGGVQHKQKPVTMLLRATLFADVLSI